MGLCRATLPRGDSYHRTLRCSHSYLTLTVYEEVQYESAHDVILSGGRPVQYSWATGSADCWRHTSATRFRRRSLPCVTVCMWCWSSQQHAVDVWRTQTYTDTDRLRTLRSCSHYARKRARVPCNRTHWKQWRRSHYARIRFGCSEVSVNGCCFWEVSMGRHSLCTFAFNSEKLRTRSATNSFLQRAQCSHCKRCTSYSNSVRPSVCLSVCPSHAGIVSKRRHVARCSLHCWIAKCV